MKIERSNSHMVHTEFLTVYEAFGKHGRQISIHIQEIKIA